MTSSKIKIPTASEGQGIISNNVGIFNAQKSSSDFWHTKCHAFRCVANTISRKSASETYPSQATGSSQQIKDIILNSKVYHFFTEPPVKKDILTHSRVVQFVFFIIKKSKTYF